MIATSKTTDEVVENTVKEINKLELDVDHIKTELIRLYVKNAVTVAEHLGAMRGIKELSNKLQEVRDNE